MKLEGDYWFEATVPEVWSALFDPVILAAVMPGCEKLELVDGQYVGEIKVKVGPIQGKFTGKVDLKDKDEPHSYTMIVDGRGAPGFVKATAGVKLTEEGAGTRVFYDTDAQVGGKIASVGQRLIEASARAIVAQSLEGLHTNIKLRAAAYREALASQAAAPVVAAAPPASASPVASTSPVPGVEPAPVSASAAPAGEPTSVAAGPGGAAAGAASAAAGPVSPAPADGVASAAAGPVSPAPAAEPAPASARPAPAPATAGTAGPGPAAVPATPPPTEPVAAPARAAAGPATATATAAPVVAFTPVKTKQSALANAVAKEVASSLFPRSVLVAIILIEALVIVWLLLRH